MSSPSPTANIGQNKVQAKRWVSGLFTCLAYSLVSGCANKHDLAQEWELCPGIIVHGEIKPGLTDTEKRLVCGDKNLSDPEGRAWAKIPYNQAQYSLSTFLQDRAMYRPVYSDHDGNLHVTVGEPTRISRIVPDGAPSDFDLERKRLVVGELLTPKLLGVLEQWTTGRLQSLGYGCPTVTSDADPISGEVKLHTQAGFKQSLVSVIEEPIGGMAPGMLDRYDAFQLGDTFNGDLLTISSRRILAQGLLEGIHYKVTCDSRGVSLSQSAFPGLPRLLSVGFGTNTEGLLLVKASWKNVRVGKAGSLAALTAEASKNNQQIDASFTWYYTAEPSRRYLLPAVEFRHRNEVPFETLASRFQVSEGTSSDGDKMGYGFRAGPAYDANRTLRGVGPSNSHFVSLDTQAVMTSHYSEFYRGSPRAGFASTFNGNFNSKHFLSDFSAQRLGLTTEALWNYRQYDPPLAVLGFRGGFNTTVTGERPGPRTGLTPDFLKYLGGSTDLRGFGKQELGLSYDGNDQPLGGLTAGFADFELRMGSVLPFGLQPFTFLDLGKLSSEPFDLVGPLFWSPGLGIRWESPFGAFRTTLAHGYLAGDSGSSHAHLQFFLSFGEEF